MKSSQQKTLSPPSEVNLPVSISSVMRMTSSSLVEAENYWKEKSSPSSSSFCKNEVWNFLPRRRSSPTWRKVLIPRTKRAQISQRETAHQAFQEEHSNLPGRHPEDNQSRAGHVGRRSDP